MSELNDLEALYAFCKGVILKEWLAEGNQGLPPNSYIARPRDRVKSHQLSLSSHTDPNQNVEVVQIVEDGGRLIRTYEIRKEKVAGSGFEYELFMGNEEGYGFDDPIRKVEGDPTPYVRHLYANIARVVSPR